jgi:hypothetical protein
MIINCGPTIAERLEARYDKKWRYLTQWHPHFFLIPRRMGNNRCAWLEWGRRKLRIKDHGYYGAVVTKEYRLSVERDVLDEQLGEAK